MTKFVILGAYGQLGRELVSILPSEEVKAFSREQLNITDTQKLRDTLISLQPQIVFNCAAFVQVDDAEELSNEAWEVNARSVFHLAKLCQEFNIKLVHLSTDYVFDGRKGSPYTELDTPSPLNVYGVTKLMGEFFVRAYCHRHFVVRTAGLYGRKGSKSKGGSFIERILSKAKSGEPLKVVTDQKTSPTYTKDLAQHLVKLAMTDKFGLYHIANSGYCSWHEFATEILKLVGMTTTVEEISSQQVRSKAKRPSFSALVSVRLLSVGLTPLRHWREALSDFLQNFNLAQ